MRRPTIEAAPVRRRANPLAPETTQQWFEELYRIVDKGTSANVTVPRVALAALLRDHSKWVAALKLNV